MSNRHGHAVVIGSSIAGLLAARVLADHFAAVTVLERDQLPSDGPAHRRGVPQAQHLHQMLMRGQLVFEQLFPGLRQDLLAAGAPEMDSAQDFLWRNPTGWGVRYRSGVIRLAFTRDLLDWHVRLHLSKLSSVRSQAGAEVVGLLPTGGVSLADSSRLDADLVVDASGRGSRAAAWLRQLGYPPPAEQIVDAHLGYASRLYHHPTDCHNDWQAVFIQAAPPARNRAGVITSVEGERWMMSLAGGARDWPPTDAVGFLAFARSLPSPIVYDAIRQAQPASAITGTRSGENRLRRFDTLPRSPERFVALGDAVCAFNPVYGQGMSVAALEALALDSCLRQYGTSLARPFQKQVAHIVALPWALATSEDSRYSGTEGAALDPKTRVLHGYMDHVLALATERTDVRQALLEVQHMLRPPLGLFRPSIAGAVLARQLRRRPARAPLSPAPSRS
jgi:2-polyprenyl-6-methoxyphenol hydroxylase-like FAD-dependent oxidoreductase